MPHFMKGVWRTYLIVDVPNLRYLYPDGTINLDNITDDGDVKDCVHNGKKLKGKVRTTGSGADEVFHVQFEHHDDAQKFRGKLVRAGNNSLVAGQITFRTAVRLEFGTEVLSQTDGDWVLTRP